MCMHWRACWKREWKTNKSQTADRVQMSVHKLICTNRISHTKHPTQALPKQTTTVKECTCTFGFAPNGTACPRVWLVVCTRVRSLIGPMHFDWSNASEPSMTSSYIGQARYVTGCMERRAVEKVKERETVANIL